MLEENATHPLAVLARAAPSARARLEVPPSYVLTTSCPNIKGVVAAVAGFLSKNGCVLTEAQQFDDPATARTFMRTVFHTEGARGLAVCALSAAFAREVAPTYAMHWRLGELGRRCRCVLAVSNRGHCLTSLLHRWSTRSLPIEIVSVVSNHQDLRSLAEWHGVPFHYLPILDGRKQDQEDRLLEVVERSEADLLVLARYMQILSDEACRRLDGRAINIHHSFLPGFKGAKAYHQAHARGVKLIGATAHYVTGDLDEGPIIEQEVARIDHSLTPDEFVHVGSELESVVLNRAIKWHAEQRVFRNGNRTVVLK